MGLGSDDNHACVFGLCWGDEGKGKVVDLLCEGFDLVVRFNGGSNAGHTVCVGGESFALHLLPTGVLHEDKAAVIGPGVAVDPAGLVSEMDGLIARGITVGANLKISDRAHLVLPYHKIEDQLSEKAASASARIGTTARGIGPCYADKMKRTTAIRAVDLFDPDRLATRVRGLVDQKKKIFGALYGEDGGLNADAVIEELTAAGQRLCPLICDTTRFLHDAMDEGRSILFEGANGLLLDIDHGTFPFVTSSSTGPHGINAGAGVPVSKVSRLIGVTKAYSTRVGSGPFVSELKDELGDRIREQGKEFGTTTGRPRRCGWFDAVSNRYTARLVGATEVALMHLDTLSGFEQVGICVGYEIDGEKLDSPPADARRLERARPIVEYMPGWSEGLREMGRFEDLPQTARDYIERVEALIGAPVSILSVGPDRLQTIFRRQSEAEVKTAKASSS